MQYHRITVHPSPVNHAIEVRQTPDSQFHLLVDDIVQSGPIITAIWDQATHHLLSPTYTPNHILILGYGAGASTHLLQTKYPQAHITGVDLDPEMTKLAPVYFPTGNHQQIKLIHQDILTYITQLPPHNLPAHTLTIIDVSIGPKVPHEISQKHFLTKLLSFSDYILINLFTIPSQTKYAFSLLQQIRQHFTTTEHKLPNNLIVKIPSQLSKQS